MNEAEFRAACVGEGWDAPSPKSYPANDTPAMHSHDFDATVLIVDGELQMAFPDRVDVLGPGDRCIVPAGTVHSEQTGAAGATGWLATRQRRSSSDA